MDTPAEHIVQRDVHGLGEDWLVRAEAEQPFGRLIKPEEAARTICYLLSDESGMMTGASLDFDQSVVGAGDSPKPAAGEVWPVTLRIGILGCGRIGRMHAELIALRVPGLALSRVYDVRAESAEETAAALDCQVAASPEELIGADDVDAIAICSSHRHPRRPAGGRRGGRQAHLLREAAVARPGRGRPGPRRDPGLRRAAPGRLQPPLRPQPPARCGSGSRPATSASSTSSASPAATRRRRPSPTSRCPAGSSAT